jgi:hypothetical protein
MKTEKRTKFICRLANGKYVEDYEYSQGHFSLIETGDALRAQDFFGREPQFNTFFKKDGAELVLVCIEINFVEVKNISK